MGSTLSTTGLVAPTNRGVRAVSPHVQRGRFPAFPLDFVTQRYDEPVTINRWNDAEPVYETDAA